jgi:hypothetical protein
MTAIALPRPLDRSEAFFWFLDHFSSMNFAVIAECDARFSGDALRAALATAGQRHPLLNAGIDRVDGRLHFVPHAATGIPLEEVVAADWRTALAERIVRPFALGEAPLVRAVAIDDTAGGSVLALIFHHVVGDARSAFPVLTEVLAALAGEAPDPAGEELLPPLSALYPPQLSGEAGRLALEQLKAARKAAFERLGPPAAQAGHRIDSGKQARMIGLDLTPAETAALATHARAAGTTVNGLIGAAQLIALRERFGDDAERVLGLTCAADLRPYLVPPVAATTPGFYVTLVTMLQRVGGEDSLWPLAKRLSEGIRQQLVMGVGHLFYDLMPPADQFPVNAEGIAQFCALMARGVQTSLLSNVGRLAPLPELPGIGVRARSFALCPTTTQPVFTAVATHDNGMTLNLNYNATQFGADDAGAVAATLLRLLRGAAA